MGGRGRKAGDHHQNQLGLGERIFRRLTGERTVADRSRPPRLASGGKKPLGAKKGNRRGVIEGERAEAFGVGSLLEEKKK